MSDEKKTVFRDKALRLYLKNQQRIVFLRLAQPRLFPYFWGLLGGLAVVAGLAWSTRVPVTVTGVGLVTGRDGAPGTEPGALILLLPPDSLGQLRPQQRVLVRDRKAEPVLVGRIAKVEPAVLSPDVIRARFALDGALAGFVTGPAAVAVARVEAETGGLPAATYSGGSSPIDIEIGSRRVLSLIPGLGSLFEARFH
jgi:hypothetical protein